MIRRLAVAAIAAAVLGLPATAAASPQQITILQDNAVLLGLTQHDPDQAMAEAKALGVDAIRVFLAWNVVSPSQSAYVKPPGFDVGDPNSLGYNWRWYDGVVERARRHGLKVYLVLSPAIPYWASEEPTRCPHLIGGYAHETLSCMWKPSPSVFKQFVKAVALRYGQTATPHGGTVATYSLWNEPNLEHYLFPQLQHTRFGTVDLAARRYRELWLAGYESIARYDPSNRGKVLFGETAAISSPVDTLYTALCLDSDGKPFRGRLKVLQGCARPRKLPVGGFAHHPYNKEALGSVFTRSATKDSLPMAYLGRLHRLIDTAARYRRIPRRRGIYVTEFGFQSSPPDPIGESLSLSRQASALNEAEHLFYKDPRIKSTAQYELYDVPGLLAFNTGLRFEDGRPKPSLDAFRMPLTATRLASSKVEIWGMVRPATGAVRPQVRTVGRGGRVVARPRTNSRGYYRAIVRGAGAARRRYQGTWTAPSGEILRSRVAAAGREIRYLDQPVKPKPSRRSKKKPSRRSKKKRQSR